MRIRAGGGGAVLVDGPATLTVSGGEVSIFGADYGPGSKLVVPRGKRLPLLIADEAVVSKGRAGTATVMRGNPIPTSWSDVVEAVREAAPGAVLVLGGTGTGKSSLCLYKANVLSKDGVRVGVLNCDLGQSDIGPPGTIGLVVIDRPHIGFWEVEPAAMVFVGAKNSATAVRPMIAGLERMGRFVAAMGLDTLIINSDGWIGGFGAIHVKQEIVDMFSPELTVAIKKNGELDAMVEALKGTEVRTVEAPRAALTRSRKARREFRERTYRRYLKNARVREFPMSFVQGHDEGMDNALVGLEDRDGRLLGIGVVSSIERRKDVVRIFTPVRADVQSIRAGSIRLSKRGKELE